MSGTPLRIAALDLNGQWRGKRLSGAAAGKAADGVRMPLSALSVDIFGADIDGSPLVFDSGDADGVLRPTSREAVPMPWLATAQNLQPAWMFHDDGSPFAACPRQALAAVLARCKAMGCDVQAGVEMEFTLVDDTGADLTPPRDPWSGRPLRGEAILSMRQLDAFDGYLSALSDGADQMGIEIETLTSEAGVGQFEVTLGHTDAMQAADNAALFKLLARGMARAHGLAATFMAKPYVDDAGNGMHVHASFVDNQGRNLFDNGSSHGSDALGQAIAGCLQALRASSLIFAPHGNSYARLVPGAHAPTAAVWGYDNRTASLRVPGGAPKARRFEHRVPGGDTNPHLVIAAILGAACDGITRGTPPPAPITGNAYTLQADGLAPSWAEAIEIAAHDPHLERLFAPDLIATLVRTKRQELRKLGDIDPDKQWQVWLETV